MDRWKVYKKCDEYRVRSPKKVADLIEIKSIAENGIFEVGKGGIFTKLYHFTDINYETLSFDKQILVLDNWAAWLNSNSLPFVIYMNNKNRNEQKLYDEVLFELQDDSLDTYRTCLNDEVEKRILDARAGIEQELYILLRYTDSNKYEDARLYFSTVENAMEDAFRTIGSVITPYDASDRLRILHDFYCFGEEELFDFNFKNAVENGVDFKNCICPGKMDFNPVHERYFISNDRTYGCCMYIRVYPSRISDRFLTTIMNLNIRMMVSIFNTPIPDTEVDIMLESVYAKINRSVSRQTKNRVKELDFNTEVSDYTEAAKQNIKKQKEERRDENQQYTYTMINFAILGNDLEDLWNNVNLIKQTAKRFSVLLDYSYMRQREALNTILPIGVKQVANGENRQTKSLAAFLPFRSQELYQPGGNVYGNNQVTKQLIMINRKKLTNPHAFFFGVTGSGKTTLASLEMLQSYIRTQDDFIVISPKNDYANMADLLGGTFVDVSSSSDVRFNGFSYFDNGRRINIADEKLGLALAICETCKKSDLTPKERSTINRALKSIYSKYGNEQVTMRALDAELALMPGQEAADLRMYLELFVSGSLNIFADESNLNISSRFIVFGLKNMGEELRDISMIIMLEYIKERIMYNYSKGVATWFYIDEFAEVLKTEYQRSYLKSLWMLLRSQGAIITALTQNVTDTMVDFNTHAMLENAEIRIVMKQNDAAERKLIEEVGLPPEMLKYVLNEAHPGRGLISCGNVTIPFDASLTKNTPLYDLINTNFHEMNIQK